MGGGAQGADAGAATAAAPAAEAGGGGGGGGCERTELGAADCVGQGREAKSPV
jgi:hypothetical protein